MYNGIDVSNIQPANINWQALATAGISFAAIKCGNGNNGIDNTYATHLAGAKAAGLKVFVYHAMFPLPTTAAEPTRDPIWQANFHYNASQGEIAAIDLEWPTPQDWAQWGCSAKQIVDWTLAYLQEYERLSGRKPLIYSYPNFIQSLANVPEVSQFANYPLWIASYEPTPFIPHPWTDWVVWQDSSGPYHLPDSGQAVDTDKVRDLSLWDTAQVAPSPQAPTPPPVVSPPAPVVVSAPSEAGIVSLLVNIWNAISQFLFTRRE
jgi:GH25 family lysozyme M1 (1,4-beta-N-acetylmuramidase)